MTRLIVSYLHKNTKKISSFLLLLLHTAIMIIHYFHFTLDVTWIKVARSAINQCWTILHTRWNKMFSRSWFASCSHFQFNFLLSQCVCLCGSPMIIYSMKQAVYKCWEDFWVIVEKIIVIITIVEPLLVKVEREKEMNVQVVYFRGFMKTKENYFTTELTYFDSKQHRFGLLEQSLFKNCLTNKSSGRFQLENPTIFLHFAAVLSSI